MLHHRCRLRTVEWGRRARAAAAPPPAAGVRPGAAAGLASLRGPLGGAVLRRRCLRSAEWGRRARAAWRGAALVRVSSAHCELAWPSVVLSPVCWHWRVLARPPGDAWWRRQLLQGRPWRLHGPGPLRFLQEWMQSLSALLLPWGVLLRLCWLHSVRALLQFLRAASGGAGLLHVFMSMPLWDRAWCCFCSRAVRGVHWTFSLIQLP